MAKDEQRLMTPYEVAEYLRLPVGTLYAWRYKGMGPPATRLGRDLRYRRDALLKWLAEIDESTVKGR
jgi:excisionase family DNA binding protein